MISCRRPRRRASPAEDLVHIAGPQASAAKARRRFILGPGTGLGVAQLLLDEKSYRVVETEGGHVDFAPRDPFEDALLHRLRRQYLRCRSSGSSPGPGLAPHPRGPARRRDAPRLPDDKALWDGGDRRCRPIFGAALEQFCRCFGSIAGDVALIQGGEAIVAGWRPAAAHAHILPSSGFAQRLTAKGRYTRRWPDLPVWLIVHPSPDFLARRRPLPRRKAKKSNKKSAA